MKTKHKINRKTVLRSGRCLWLNTCIMDPKYNILYSLQEQLSNASYMLGKIVVSVWRWEKRGKCLTILKSVRYTDNYFMCFLPLIIILHLTEIVVFTIDSTASLQQANRLPLQKKKRNKIPLIKITQQATHRWVTLYIWDVNMLDPKMA